MKLGKKKKEAEIITPQTDEVEIGAESKEHTTEITEEQKETIAQVEYYRQRYDGVFTPDLFPSTAIQSNLLFGILSELKKLNEQIKEMNDEE